MIAYPHIDPVLLQIGPLAIRWYGAMYSLSFLLGWPLLLARGARWRPDLSKETLSDFMVWILLGVVLGGRFGYILFYQFDYYAANPFAVFRVWEGGMAFHGGLLGVAFAVCYFARRHRVGCLELADLLAPIVPLGLFFGRIGNFINGELWGRATDVPWAMVFPTAGPQLRHPSQLYEAGLEGCVLFAVLWWLGRKQYGPGLLFGVFLLLYGTFRTFLEFFREPDSNLGLLALGLSMGQWLSVPMVVAGVTLIVHSRRPH